MYDFRQTTCNIAAKAFSFTNIFRNGIFNLLYSMFLLSFIIFSVHMQSSRYEGVFDDNFLIFHRNHVL